MALADGKPHLNEFECHWHEPSSQWIPATYLQQYPLSMKVMKPACRFVERYVQAHTRKRRNQKVKACSEH